MPDSKHELLTPANNTLVLIDYQPQMLFGVTSIEGSQLIQCDCIEHIYRL